MNSDLDKRLVFGILQYLRNLRDSGSQVVSDISQLDAAAAALSAATKVSLNDAHLGLVAKNGTPMTLRGIFDVAATTAAPVASAVSAVKSVSDEEKEVLLVPEDLREKFRSYLDKLKSTIYFKDIEEGTPAWGKRVSKAREKFMRKYGSTVEVKTQPPAADPAKAERLKNEGNEKLKAGDYEGAVRLYGEAIALRPDCAVYYSNRAAARQYLNQHQLALEDAQKSVEIDPSFFKGFMRIGHSLVALGRNQQAIEDGFERALRLQPDDVSAKEAIAAARAKMDTAANLFTNPGIREMANNLPANAEDLMNPEMIRMAMQAMQDPQMQQMMQSPMFQNMAREAAANPDMLKNLMGGMGKK